jgi:SAM-dependent methyltransferase
MTDYTEDFYTEIRDGSLASARAVVPELLTLLEPKSVVDIGCGTGAWLSAFREKGIEDVRGVDGDYVKRNALLIPQENFQAADLTQPLSLGRRFDLAISLEVAEHIAPERAGIYVDNLTRLSDVIAFSAAIPHQTGHGHVNEQWPDYWRDLFEKRGYRVVDAMRKRIWTLKNVERWYKQNLLIYVKADRLSDYPALAKEAAEPQTMLALVHPETFLTPSVGLLIHWFPGAFKRAILRRWKKWS